MAEAAAQIAGQAVRRCVRCDTSMMRGELTYRDSAHSGDTTRGPGSLLGGRSAGAKLLGAAL